MSEPKDKAYLTRLIEINDIKDKSNGETLPNIWEIIDLMQEMGEIFQRERIGLKYENGPQYGTIYYRMKEEIDELIKSSNDLLELLESNKSVNKMFNLLYRKCIKGELAVPSDDELKLLQRTTINDMFFEYYKIINSKDEEIYNNMELYNTLKLNTTVIKKYYGDQVLNGQINLLENGYIIAPPVILENTLRAIEDEYINHKIIENPLNKVKIKVGKKK